MKMDPKPLPESTKKVIERIKQHIREKEELQSKLLKKRKPAPTNK